MLRLVLLSVLFSGYAAGQSQYNGLCRRYAERYSDAEHVLTIENFDFGTINKDRFVGVDIAMPHLDTVLLRNVSIDAIEPGGLSPLAGADCIDLSGNKLTEIDAGALRGINACSHFELLALHFVLIEQQILLCFECVQLTLKLALNKARVAILLYDFAFAT